MRGARWERGNFTRTRGLKGKRLQVPWCPATAAGGRVGVSLRGHSGREACTWPDRQSTLQPPALGFVEGSSGPFSRYGFPSYSTKKNKCIWAGAQPSLLLRTHHPLLRLCSQTSRLPTLQHWNGFVAVAVLCSEGSCHIGVLLAA